MWRWDLETKDARGFRGDCSQYNNTQLGGG